MSSLAAILVVVVCPTGTGHCLKEPVRVVSYDTFAQCEQHRATELKSVRRSGLTVYGNCNPVGAGYLAGRKPINMTASIDSILPAGKSSETAAKALGFAD